MAKSKSDILTDDNQHLRMMYNTIEVDKELPKYMLIKEEVEAFRNQKLPSTSLVEEADEGGMDVPTNDLRRSLREKESIKELIKNYDKIRVGNVRDVNIFINKYLFKDVFSGFNEYAKFNGNIVNGASWIEITNDLEPNDPDAPKKVSKWPKIDKFAVFRRLSDMLRAPSKELEGVISVSVLEFFAQVKGLARQNKDAYVNRLDGYIVALKNCDISGQTALKEKLVRDMVINKYESVLFAEGHYYVVTEQQIVDFVKKTEKGVRLTYVKNYMRVIPSEVVSKIDEMNRFEIFDNYAVLHYDPDLMAFGETIEETKKRRDPILFGLIKGSNKLYFITDWIDEFCDLTLEKFVETLQIQKDSLKLSETIKTE